ncbi:UNVERIFIED_CONTAM: hypothetical protein GTU68_038596, partial [Idotea baltica]|nr:hypothetical protein [Idotea baltica]
PHLSGNGEIALIHNGIIENYSTLKDALIELGHEFKSDTDTEVLVHLIEEIQKKDDLPIGEAVKKSLEKVVGAYAIVVMDKKSPDVLIGARNSSPLVFGLGEDEFFLGSDASPIIKYTNKVIYLEDEDVISINRNGEYKITNLQNKTSTHKIKELDLKIEELEKGGFDHFMLKEIYQQPSTIEQSWAILGGMSQHMNRISKSKRIILMACGTSWHSALIGEYLFEEIARIPTEVEYASEFRYRNPIIREDDFIIALSQSGETADTLAAIEIAKEKGAFVYGIVNVVGSSIARLTDSGSYIHAGPEIGVASTKAFTSQVSILTLMALYLDYRELLTALEVIPQKVQQILEKNEQIKYIASEIKNASNALYLGRGYNFPVALEGALKLKEISYIHAEGYPAAEMKHGPIALIDMYMPVVVIATNQSAYEKIVSNIQEVKARKGIVIAIINEDDTIIREMADFFVEIPTTAEPLSPLLSVIPLQLLSYHIALMRGCNVDQPRNLAKSVTVE